MTRHARRSGVVLHTLIAVVLAVGPAVVRAEAGACAYVTNRDSDSVSVIDTVTNAVLANVPGGDTPEFVAVHPQGTRVYVSSPTTGKLSVISTATNTIIDTLSVAGALAVNPAGTRVYVANKTARNVAVIDTATDTVTATIPVGGNPSGVAVNPAGSRVYVANELNATVSVIDAATNAVITTIGVGGTPSAVAVHPAGTFVYIANQTSNFVSVMDATINAVTATVPVLSPVGVAVNAAGTRLYVTNSGLDTLSVIDTASNRLITAVAVRHTPQGVAVHPAGTFAYVANQASNSVSVVDAGTNRVTATVPVQLRPTSLGPFVGPDLALSARVTLSGTQFRVGQTLTVGIDAQNPAGGTAADLYVGALLPDGQTAVFFVGGGVVGSATTLGSPAQFRSFESAPPCFVLSEPAFFRFTFPSTGIAPGTYQVFAVLARQGAFADNRIDPSDILASDVKTLTFSP